MCVFTCFVGSDSYEFDVISIISFIENVLLENTCDNLYTYVLIRRDFNFDECKMKSYALLKCFKDFMQLTDFIVTRNNVNYTYHCDTKKCYSKIDHFIISAPLQSSRSAIETIDSPDDFSDHFPILLDLSMLVSF